MTLFYPRCMAQVSAMFDGRGGADVGPILLEVQPTSAHVALTGYHEADTWSITFDLRTLPLDPDLLRSVVVAVYMWGAEEYREQRKWAVDAHRMVIGLADEGSVDVDLDRQTVSLEGRDYTGLLLDQDWDPRERVQAGRPIDEEIQRIADAAAPPGASLRFAVRYKSKEALPPPITGRGRRGTKRRGLPVGRGKSYWDVIYELALSHGLIVFVQGTDIIVTDPQTQTGESLGQAPAIVYGHELESLEIRRRFARERIPQLRVVGYNPRTRRLVEVIYPRRHEAPETGLGVKKSERIFLPAERGVYDEATLRRYAAIIYENMARGEASYHFRTFWLRDRANADLLGLRAGQPVILGFDPWNAENFRVLSPASRVRHLLDRGYSPSVAGVVAAHYERLAQFRQPHYTRVAEYSYSIEDGLETSVEAVNYAYEPRELKEQAT